VIPGEMPLAVSGTVKQKRRMTGYVPAAFVGMEV